MKRRALLIITILAITLTAVPFVYGGGRGHRGAGMGGNGFGHGGFGALAMLGHAKEKLGLTDQQADEIKAIFQSTREENKQYHEQLRDGLAGVTSTLLQDPSNVAAAQALLDQQASAERAMKSNMLNAASKALNVLTAEQRTKLADLIAEHKAKREQRKRG
ncbi:MAG: periplasmic heavy metal sensor [Thermoanaerobaculia bacterium]|nr:periplasmic heavy metal sensor [Thermoanaerobaculia bacterium]